MDQHSPKSVYFVADVHLGLEMGDPAQRESLFVDFLRSLGPDNASALYMLGDIWDYWYEYRDVVPKCGLRVVAALADLVDRGVEVYFCPGNHDTWTYSYLQSLGLRKFYQPYRTEIFGKTFCLGHGDALGGAKRSYRLMMWVFNCRFFQALFSALHPRQAFSIMRNLSHNNRQGRAPYRFRGEDEPLYRFALEESSRRHTDYFVFGHFHDEVDMTLPDGGKFYILKDWIGGGVSYARFNGSSFELHSPESLSE